MSVASDRRFGRQRRLVARDQFDAVLRRADVRLASGPFRLAARANCVGLARLGLVVGKRAAARAVDRNRVKRCIRESFRMAMNDLPAMDVVIRLVAAPPARGDAGRTLASLWSQLAQPRRGSR